MGRPMVMLAGARAGGVGDVVEAAARPFVTHALLANARSIVVAVGSNGLAREAGGPVRQVASLLAVGGRSVRVVAPSRLPRGLRGSDDTRHWTTRPLTHDAARLDAVPVPAAMAEADAVVLVNRLPTAADRTSPVLGVWSRYVPLKLRLGAVASGPREGFAAEIALAFQPALVVLAGKVRGMAVAVATGDQLAAELFGLALAAIARDETDTDEETAIGPWEDPLVQRATELGIGVSLPSDIDVHSHLVGSDDDGRDAFEELLAGVLSALGIPGPA